MRRLLLGVGTCVALVAAPAWAATSQVEVRNNSFAPATVQIQPGDEVRWIFKGSNHSVTSDSGQSESFDSDPGEPFPVHPMDDTFSHTFNSPGRFTYFCKVHASTMKGTVLVGDQGGGEPPPQEPPPGGDTTAPGVSTLVAKGGRKCRRRQRKCKPRPTRVTFTLSEDASVRISFARAGG